MVYLMSVVVAAAVTYIPRMYSFNSIYAEYSASLLLQGSFTVKIKTVH
uniref:Uncharacterized protein n=1 Tax=Ciona intestinalis TaxID=7719 RepID=H2XY95_CIOIN